MKKSSRILELFFDLQPNLKRDFDGKTSKKLKISKKNQNFDFQDSYDSQTIGRVPSDTRNVPTASSSKKKHLKKVPWNLGVQFLLTGAVYIYIYANKYIC